MTGISRAGRAIQGTIAAPSRKALASGQRQRSSAAPRFQTRWILKRGNPRPTGSVGAEQMVGAKSFPMALTARPSARTSDGPARGIGRWNRIYDMNLRKINDDVFYAEDAVVRWGPEEIEFVRRRGPATEE